MRLERIHPRSELLGRLRASRGRSEEISVSPRQVASYEKVGWQVKTISKTRVRLERERSLDDWVETLAWRAMYLLGFPHISGDRGAKLIRGEGVENQLDVVAYDDESAVVVECKSSDRRSSRVDVAAELAILDDHRSAVRRILNHDRHGEDKLKVGGILVLHGVPFTNADRRRAADMNLVIFDAAAVHYYERLAGYVGEAGRYQLFGEVFEGQEVPGLSLKLAAVEFTMGDRKAYSFAIRPADLLKISFVARRGRGDIQTYQRMVSKRRLRDIVGFIDEGGVFPTNIVINFQRQGTRSRLRFDPAAQEPEATPGSRLGYLSIPSVYQAAWIIDGQHRLLAYSGHKWASTASLAVTAFDGLDPDKQAELFEKINSKQKKVSANLLVELFSTLHWNSRDPKLQVRAVASQVAQDLRSDPSSPLHGRILNPDEKTTVLRCITLTELVPGLQRPGMFVRSEIRGGVIRLDGVFWTGSADTSRLRAMAIVSAWFETIRAACPEMWEAGNDENLGLVATNRGVNASLRVLGWVLMHLRAREANFDLRREEEVIAAIEPYGRLVGGFFNVLTPKEVGEFRRHYGTGAAAEIANNIGRAVRESDTDFAPEGLLDWIERKSRVDIGEAQRLCTDIERRLMNSIISRMKEEYGDESWWREVPVTVRREAAARREEEPEDHPPETFLQLIDLRTIIQSQWSLFQQTHAMGKGSKQEKTSWLVGLNDIRRRADHAGGVRLKLEDIEALKEIDVTLAERGI